MRIDDHDVRDLTSATIARAVGVVTQESYLFHATVRENLRYARPDATDAEVEQAARAAFIHDRIIDLENGYDTMVGERGYRFSGGERQRLAIARVILKDPRVLILDEATSALDTESERIVQRALDSVMRGRTTIAIAHRLSTIRAADVIFVLDHGQIIERGNHDELVKRDGLYARLYEEQFGGGTVEAFCSDGVVLADGRCVRPIPAQAGKEAVKGAKPNSAGGVAGPNTPAELVSKSGSGCSALDATAGVPAARLKQVAGRCDGRFPPSSPAPAGPGGSAWPGAGAPPRGGGGFSPDIRVTGPKERPTPDRMQIKNIAITRVFI